MKPDIKGLTKLAQVLKRAPREKFDIWTWAEKGPACGSKGCIAGWAAFTFPHRFKLELYDNSWETNDKMYEVVHKASGLRGEEGFAKAFKISDIDAERLTVTNLSHKRTPKAAAKAVMALVGKLKKAMKK